MGENTWTQSLHHLATKEDDEFAEQAIGASLVMSSMESAFIFFPLTIFFFRPVDGPYGRARPFTSRAILVLLAGGVGVTPLYSIFAELHARISRPGARDPLLSRLQEVNCFVIFHITILFFFLLLFIFPSSHKQVHLVWVCPDNALFLWFSDLLKAVVDTPIESVFV